MKLVNTDTLVTENHFLCYFGQSIDSTCVYNFVEGLYYLDNECLTADQVVLMKMLQIRYFQGVLSLCQTVRDIDMNIA